jgi:hypothetical protein
LDFPDRRRPQSEILRASSILLAYSGRDMQHKLQKNRYCRFNSRAKSRAETNAWLVPSTLKNIDIFEIWSKSILGQLLALLDFRRARRGA